MEKMSQQRKIASSTLLHHRARLARSQNDLRVLHEHFLSKDLQRMTRMAIRSECRARNGAGDQLATNLHVNQLSLLVPAERPDLVLLLRQVVLVHLLRMGKLGHKTICGPKLDRFLITFDVDE